MDLDPWEKWDGIFIQNPQNNKLLLVIYILDETIPVSASDNINWPFRRTNDKFIMKTEDMGRAERM